MIDQIVSKKKEYCDLIREYVRSQKPLWQKIPYLYLCCHGISGYGNDMDFERGVFKISHRLSVSNYETLYIDCSNGELVSSDSFDLAGDALVIRYNYNILNAQMIVNYYENTLQKENERLAEIGAWVNHELEHKTANNNPDKYFRYRIAKTNNIRPIYERL
jgi:hypothetical protein